VGGRWRFDVKDGIARNDVVFGAVGDRPGPRSIHGAIEPLEGRLVHLRPAEARDEPAFLAILTDPTVDRWWQSDDPPAEAREKVTQDEIAVWAIESESEVVGLIQAAEETEPQYRHASIDIVLASRGQDRGLGSDAVRTVAGWLFDVRGHHRLTIDPAASNARAIRAYERVGFRPVGVMRRYERARDRTWHDGLLMDLLAEEFTRR
jgi:aminoglycoside 6'-N-acetyltransferase